MKEKEKKILKIANKKLKKANIILSTIKKIEKSRRITEQVNLAIPQNINQPINTNITSLQRLQIQANKDNIKEIEKIYEEKIKKIEELTNRILINKAKIREIKTKIEEKENSLETHNPLLKDIQIYKTSLENTLSTFDNIEINLFDVQNFLKNLLPNIENLKNIVITTPETIDPKEILNMKNNVTYAGKLIKNITEKIKDTEEELILIKNNINEFIENK